MILNNLGKWSAITNTPTLVDGVGNAGDYYTVNAFGSVVNFGSGNISFNADDIVTYNGTRWQKIAQKRSFHDIITSVKTETEILVADGGYYNLSFRNDSVFGGATVQIYTSAQNKNIIFAPVMKIGTEIPQEYSIVQSGIALAYITAGTLIKLVAFNTSGTTNIIIDIC